MLSEKLVKAFNSQINAELFSSYLYLSMAAYLQKAKFSGFSKWMVAQAEEEKEHALKLFNFLVEVGAEIELEAIEKPKINWEGPKNVFEEALHHEHYITDRINKLMDLAIEEKCHAARTLLNWFVDEQVEEVANASEIVDKFEMIGESKGSLYMLDRELGKRQES